MRTRDRIFRGGWVLLTALALGASVASSRAGEEVDRLAEAAILARQDYRVVPASHPALQRLRFIIAVKASDFETVPALGLSNLYQVQNSNGGGFFEKRFRLDRNMLELPMIGSEPRELFPKSTYVDTTSDFSQVFMNAYGDVLLEFDRDALLNRLTMTPYDSLGFDGSGSSHTLAEYVDQPDLIEGYSKWGRWDYSEGQVFGSLNLSHAKRVFVTEKVYGERKAYWRELAEREGLELVTYRPKTDDTQFQMVGRKTVVNHFRPGKRRTPPGLDDLKQLLEKAPEGNGRAAILSAIAELDEPAAIEFLRSYRPAESEKTLLELALRRGFLYRRSLRHLALSKRSPLGVALVAAEMLARRGWLDEDVRARYGELLREKRLASVARRLKVDLDRLAAEMPKAGPHPFGGDPVDSVFRVREGLPVSRAEQDALEEFLRRSGPVEELTEVWRAMIRLDPNRVFRRTYLDLLFATDRARGRWIPVFDDFSELQKRAPIPPTTEATEALLRRLRSPNAKIRAKAFAILTVSPGDARIDAALARALVEAWKDPFGSGGPLIGWLTEGPDWIARKTALCAAAQRFAPEVGIFAGLLDRVQDLATGPAFAEEIRRLLPRHPELFDGRLVSAARDDAAAFARLRDVVGEILERSPPPLALAGRWIDGVGSLLSRSRAEDGPPPKLLARFRSLLERYLAKSNELEPYARLRALLHYGRHFPKAKDGVRPLAEWAVRSGLRDPKLASQAMYVFVYHFAPEMNGSKAFERAAEAWLKGRPARDAPKLKAAEKRALEDLRAMAKGKLGPPPRKCVELLVAA